MSTRFVKHIPKFQRALITSCTGGTALRYGPPKGGHALVALSDPFSAGWNLFGTRLYMVDISVINARTVWYTSVVAIVVGHIIAVWLAHVMALRTFGDNRAALRSQIPMLLLMVAYTMLSLWILAQPITPAPP